MDFFMRDSGYLDSSSESQQDELLSSPSSSSSSSSEQSDSQAAPPKCALFFDYLDLFFAYLLSFKKTTSQPLFRLSSSGTILELLIFLISRALMKMLQLGLLFVPPLVGPITLEAGPIIPPPAVKLL
ncbi:hypothetical protein FGO68_gene4390 [Halteria grandinella]|uniref:Uncharacterized protein n=1 Tax=Halteria grandinella TaxID=5974 RepID=A0A8J8T7T1_HALGN|nr:hypothetical protein FGO68_gene4390 [Halteria grandinella]